MTRSTQPVFRFAPSPNGALHLGHAYSALLNFDMARKAGGKFLVRIEDIDQTRCTPELEQKMLEDLAWMGLDWDEEPRRQSDHFDDYRSGLEALTDEGLVYPAFMTRGDIRKFVRQQQDEGRDWPNDPDGSPLYPGTESDWSEAQQAAAITEHPRHALRLNMKSALDRLCLLEKQPELFWQENGEGPMGETGSIRAAPMAWGDIVLARSDTPTSYHLSVVIDDALQGITHVVRGADLFYATSVHRVLQCLLGFPAPTYHHHGLILDDDGRKLSKSAGDTSLRTLRNAGLTKADIRRMVGL